jgi:methionyl-tRNA formyltransferase
MSPLKIIFSGSGEFGLPTLQRLLEVGHEIVTVFTQPDRPAGRGKKLTATPIGAFAESRSLKLVKTADINKETLPPADVMVVIAFGQKIASHVVDHPRFGSVNLHASRLPKYRGAAPINWAILSGETISGNSVIRLAQKMDAGAILAQSQVRIGDSETAGELHDRLALDGAPLVERVLTELAENRSHPQPQDDSQATLAPKLNRQASRIVWCRSASEIANQIRGLYPWPGCQVRLLDAQGAESSSITLVRARPISSAAHAAPPGVILPDGSIAASDGALEIVELQPQGKRPMSLSAYRNGHRWEPQMRLE